MLVSFFTHTHIHWPFFICTLFVFRIYSLENFLYWIENKNSLSWKSKLKISKNRLTDNFKSNAFIYKLQITLSYGFVRMLREWYSMVLINSLQVVFKTILKRHTIKSFLITIQMVIWKWRCNLIKEHLVTLDCLCKIIYLIP